MSISLPAFFLLFFFYFFSPFLFYFCPSFFLFVSSFSSRIILLFIYPHGYVNGLCSDSQSLLPFLPFSRLLSFPPPLIFIFFLAYFSLFLHSFISLISFHHRFPFFLFLLSSSQRIHSARKAKELSPQDLSFFTTADNTPDVAITMENCVGDAREIMKREEIEQYHTVIGAERTLHMLSCPCHTHCLSDVTHAISVMSHAILVMPHTLLTL